MASLISRISAYGYETLFRGLAKRRPPQMRQIALGPTSRVLCFTCAGIGDTLTDSVVFKALRETFPGIHLAGVVIADDACCWNVIPMSIRYFSFTRARRLSGS